MFRTFRAFPCRWLACLALGGCASTGPWPTETNYDEHHVFVRWDSEVSQLGVTRPAYVKSTYVYTLVPQLELVEIDDSVTIEEARDELGDYQGVLYAEHNYYVHPFAEPNDPHFRRQWNMENVGADIGPFPGSAGADIEAAEGWDLFTGDPNFVIAVIDSGLCFDHVDLRANIWVNPDEIPDAEDNDGNGYLNDYNGWDFVSNDNRPDDFEGHGSHVAGIIGAKGNNGIGVAGVNWDCKLMPLRFIGSGRGLTSDAIKALQYAVEKDVRVSCNSWGDDNFSQALADAIMAADAKGHIFVAAAGNQQKNIDIDAERVYPASLDLPNMITVAAVDHNDQLAPKSNWGESSVHIAAPGVYVLSTYNDGDYRFMSGTSMAAAHVAGVVAMLMAQSPGMSSKDVRQKVLDTARDVGLGSFIHSGGVVSLHAALE